MSDFTPVAVSLWVASTALILCAPSAVRISSNRAVSMPSPQAVSTISTVRPWRWHMSIHFCEKHAVARRQHGWLPGDRVLVIAVSQPPGAGGGKDGTPRPRRISARGAHAPRRGRGCRMSLNRLERWSIVGACRRPGAGFRHVRGAGNENRGSCRLIWVSPHLSPITTSPDGRRRTIFL